MLGVCCFKGKKPMHTVWYKCNDSINTNVIRKEYCHASYCVQLITVTLNELMLVGHIWLFHSSDLVKAGIWGINTHGTPDTHMHEWLPLHPQPQAPTLYDVWHQPAVSSLERKRSGQARVSSFALYDTDTFEWIRLGLVQANKTEE